MRYVYTIQFKLLANGIEQGIYKNFGAYTSFKLCKNAVSDYCEKYAKKHNEKVYNDAELSMNQKIELYSSYQWTNTGDYSKREQEEMMFSKCIECYAECKLKTYAKDKDRYVKAIHYVQIHRYRIE